jgi:hypothetical protein
MDAGLPCAPDCMKAVICCLAASCRVSSGRPPGPPCRCRPALSIAEFTLSRD